MCLLCRSSDLERWLPLTHRPDSRLSARLRLLAQLRSAQRSSTSPDLAQRSSAQLTARNTTWRPARFLAHNTRRPCRTTVSASQHTVRTARPVSQHSAHCVTQVPPISSTSTLLPVSPSPLAPARLSRPRWLLPARHCWPGHRADASARCGGPSRPNQHRYHSATGRPPIAGAGSVRRPIRERLQNRPWTKLVRVLSEVMGIGQDKLERDICTK